MKTFTVARVLAGLALVGLVFCLTGCTGRPEGLSDEQMATLVEDLIKSQPKRVMLKVFKGQASGMDKVAIMSVKVEDVSLKGKGIDRGEEIWTAEFEAKGSLVASGRQAGMYDFVFEDRIQFHKRDGKWQTRFRD